jgi:hypothetical protein
LFNEWSAKDENKGDDKGYSEKACKGTWERVIGWYDNLILDKCFCTSSSRNTGAPHISLIYSSSSCDNLGAQGLSKSSNHSTCSPVRFVFTLDVQKHLSRMRGKDAYDYHMWFKIATALYHWSTQSDDNYGFKLFNEWSAKDENKGDDKGYSEKAAQGLSKSSNHSTCSPVRFVFTFEFKVVPCTSSANSFNNSTGASSMVAGTRLSILPGAY